MNSSFPASLRTTLGVARNFATGAALLSLTGIAWPAAPLSAASVSPTAALSQTPNSLGNSAAVFAELRAAIAQGDSARVDALVASTAPLLRSALRDPAAAASLATDLRASRSVTPASAAAVAQIAGRLSLFTSTLGEGAPGISTSAGILAGALSALLARPSVTAASPAAVANAANLLSALAANPDFIAAQPLLAAQISSNTVAVAKNPAVLQVAPNASAEIAANVSLVASNAGVVAAAPELARIVAAAATAIIHHEAVSFAQPVIAIVEKNLGLTPSMMIYPNLTVSPSSE